MKKKIALISEHASPLATFGGADCGGQNVYVAELAKQLAKGNYEIDIFTRAEQLAQQQIVQYVPGVRVIHIIAGPPRPVAKEVLLPFMDDFARKMELFIKNQGITYDLVHANFFMSGLVAVRLKHALGLPFVITFHALGHIRKRHQQGNDHFPAERCQIETLVAEEAELIIAECPQDKDDLIEFYEADSSKIVIAPCGFNPAEFHPIDKMNARQKVGIAADEKIVLQLGRMVPRKGIDTVISALAHLTEDKQVKLLVVGGEIEPPCTELLRLRELAVELSIADRVEFVGSKSRNELNDYYNAADVFVTTPWYEPFGITPLEAMACALPVIGANVGGIKYTVEDGKTGFLVPPNDVDALADRLALLLDNAALRQDMGKCGATRVNEHFTWSIVANQVGEIYASIINEKKLTAQLETIRHSFEDAAAVFNHAAEQLAPTIAEAAIVMAIALQKGHKILICGNGGSAAESQHLAAELVGRFEIPFRKGMPVISLTADTAILTAWSNDFGFEDVFARQVQSYGNEGDVLICLSTSGNSPNIINAIKTAKEMEIKCINLLGKNGGQARYGTDINIIVPSQNGQRIQEVHLHLVHTLCSLVENHLFGSSNVQTDAKTAIPLQIGNRRIAALEKETVEHHLYQQNYGS